MNTLRIVLGTILVLVGVGFTALVVFGRGFRSGFGASDVHPLVVLLPYAGMALLLAGLIFAGHRPLLHVAAIAAVGLVGYCVWQIVSESATILWFGLIFLALWFVFYAHAAWGRT